MREFSTVAFSLSVAFPVDICGGPALPPAQRRAPAAVIRAEAVRPARRRRAILRRPGVVPTRAAVQAGRCDLNTTTSRRRDCHLRRPAPAARGACPAPQLRARGRSREREGMGERESGRERERVDGAEREWMGQRASGWWRENGLGRDSVEGRERE
jgi:hypothetical protein